MEIRQDPVSKLWCREDGKVLMPPTGTRFRKFRWTFGYKPTMDDFVNDIVTPHAARTKRLAEAWEKRLLEEAYRLCAWRVSYVSWYEWGNGICHCCTRIWPASQTREALKFAREKGEHVVTLNFKRWLIMSDEEFFCETRGSANYETALKLRKLLRPIVQRKCKIQLQ